MRRSGVRLLYPAPSLHQARQAGAWDIHQKPPVRRGLLFFQGSQSNLGTFGPVGGPPVYTADLFADVR